MAKPGNREQTRQRLLDQGVAFLMEQGYHGSGLQDILAAVSVPKGSFYNYFASKEEFGAAVVGHYIEPFIVLLDRCLNEPGVAAADGLERYFATLIDALEQKDFKGGCLLGNLMGEVGDTSEVCRSALAAAVARYRDKLMEGIARGQQEGIYRQDKTALEMADMLADAWQGALLRMKIERSTRPLEQCCRTLLGEYFRR